MSLTSQELTRYLQQIKLPTINISGQEKIKNTRVLCIGAGGLASPLLLYLASAGIGSIGIIDDDCVELSNLHRQVLFHERDIGRKKIKVAKNRLRAMNSHCDVQCYDAQFNADNARELVDHYDIIADCSDNFATRYLANDICFQATKPYVSASILQYQGQCLSFSGKKGPCLRCIFPDQPDINAVPDCNQGGIIGVLSGLLGIIQATEIIKWVLAESDLRIGCMLRVDIQTMQFQDYHFSQSPDCEVCSPYREIRLQQIRCEYLKGKTAMNEYIISAGELKKSLENKDDIQLLDVRTPEKHANYNIGGKLIPLSELPNRLDELDPEKPIVAYCTSGGSSMTALQLLVSAGFKCVKSLEGGMSAWRVAYHF